MSNAESLVSEQSYLLDRVGFDNIASQGRRPNDPWVTRAWRASLDAQYMHARRESHAGIEVTVPQVEIIDLHLIVGFFRSAEAGEYAGWQRPFDFGRVAWNTLATAVNSALAPDDQEAAPLVRFWDEDSGTHKLLLSPIRGQRLLDTVELLERQYQAQELITATQA